MTAHEEAWPLHKIFDRKQRHTCFTLWQNRRCSTCSLSSSPSFNNFANVRPRSLNFKRDSGSMSITFCKWTSFFGCFSQASSRSFLVYAVGRFQVRGYARLSHVASVRLFLSYVWHSGLFSLSLNHLCRYRRVVSYV